jgi:hypothetical protein
MLILEKFRNKYHQLWITIDEEKCDTKFDCSLKGEKSNCSSFKQTWPRPFIGDESLLIIVSFAHPNLFNKRSALPSALCPLLRLSPTLSPSQPRLYRRYGPRL